MRGDHRDPYLPAWHKGPREDVMSRIETYHTIVVDVPDKAADLLYLPLSEE